MKNLLVISHAGVLEVNRALYKELNRLGTYKVSMIVPESWRGDLISDLKYTANPDENLKIYPVPVAFSGNGTFFLYLGISKIIRNLNPDLIIIDEEPWSFSAAQIVFIAKSKCVFYTKQNLKKIIPWPFRVLQNWIFSKSIAALSVESEVASVLKWKGYKKPIFDLPHSFDPELFHEIESAEKTSIRDSLNLSPSSILCIYCGRLTKDKGIEDLVRAISILEKQDLKSSAEFLIVGNGELKDFVREFSAGNRKLKVTVVDAIPHHLIGKTLASADILILPSRTMSNWKEQFGRVIVEAKACGLAVIGSDSGAIGRVTQNTGDGIVYSEGNVEELSQCLQSLINDPIELERLKKSGNEYVNNELTHEAQAKSLERFVTSLNAD